MIGKIILALAIILAAVVMVRPDIGVPIALAIFDIVKTIFLWVLGILAAIIIVIILFIFYAIWKERNRGHW